MEEAIRQMIEDAVKAQFERFFGMGLPKAKTEEPKKLTFTFGDVVEALQVSRPTVYRWISKGLLTPQKVEGKVYFSPDEVQNLINGGHSRYGR